MAQTKDILVKWNVTGSIANTRLPMEDRRNIYLICKEAVNNAVKYAGCNYITIEGGQNDLRLFLIINDNGRGFRLDEQVKGHGLRNMRTRAEESNMNLEIKSEREKGTTISINYQITQRGIV